MCFGPYLKLITVPALPSSRHGAPEEGVSTRRPREGKRGLIEADGKRLERPNRLEHHKVCCTHFFSLVTVNLISLGFVQSLKQNGQTENVTSQCCHLSQLSVPFFTFLIIYRFSSIWTILVTQTSRVARCRRSCAEKQAGSKFELQKGAL